MFTGLVQGVGKVDSLESSRLVVEPPEVWPGDPWALGESIAVNGCCLTLVATGKGLVFDLSQETLGRTTLGGLVRGQEVNLERALRAGDRLGGHIVQGHVDTTGRFACWRNESVAEFAVDSEFQRYLIDKGSIAIDGVSLTVIEPHHGAFTVALIPATIETTTLRHLKPDQKVNIEFDVLAKYALNRQ